MQGTATTRQTVLLLLLLPVYRCRFLYVTEKLCPFPYLYRPTWQVRKQSGR